MKALENVTAVGIATVRMANAADDRLENIKIPLLFKW